MKKCNGSINSIETLGLLDGPGIRTVIFLNGCKLRCLFCHNPETWKMGVPNISVNELVKKILRYKPYFKNNGGVTFSGGEPLLQSDFIIEVSKQLKKENIHIALDTAGVGNGNYEEILKYIDLVILDIKAISEDKYKYITSFEMSEFNKFLEVCQKMNKKLWLRQVIIPGENDTKEYIMELKKYIKKIKNVEKVELLPYHNMGVPKYQKLNISYPLEKVKDMDRKLCKELEDLLNR